MNKTKVATLAIRTARRYPKPTVGAAKFAIRHRKGLLQTVRSARKARRGPQHLLARASDPGSREEFAAGLSTLGAAAKRIQKVGAVNAVGDEPIGELVRQAGSHLRAAVRDEPRPQTHKLRNLALIAIVGGAAYLALKRESTS